MNSNKKIAADIILSARQNGAASLDESAGKALLRSYGIRCPQSAVATSADHAEGLAEKLSGPFVVKVMSPEILHKSDVGGVALGLETASAVSAAIRQMLTKPGIASAKIDGWLVEEMAPQGREVIVGGFMDPQFGPMIMVGLGGIFVEILKDVSFRICPITRADAQAMLAELKGYALLQGARGEAPVDENALIDLILKVGGCGGLLMDQEGEIAELDLNPVIVSTQGAIAVDTRVLLGSGQVLADADRTTEGDFLTEFRPLFKPETVAVVGASTKNVTIANTFIRRLRDFGYAGEIYPIHPVADEVEGIKAWRSLGDTPRAVDYAYIAVGAHQVAKVLDGAAGRCRIAQVISSGFGEIEEGKALERELLTRAHQAGTRILGPNCLGTYSPRGRLTFSVDAPREVGHIGVIAQSGGLSTDIIKRGQWRGLRFSGVVNIGNSADVTPHELMSYYFADPQTKAIGLYIEDIKQGRAFFDLLQSAHATKPVVILKGGLSNQGRLAAASHTGAMAGDRKVWDALASQAKVVLTPTVDAFIDTLLMLQFSTLRPERPTRAVTLFGNGGGSSVLGSDAFASQGLDVLPYEGEARRLLEALDLPPGTSVANPIDTPVRTLQEKDGFIAGEILDLVYEHVRPDAIAMHLNLASFVGRGSVDPVENLFSVLAQMQSKWPESAHFGLAMRTDGSAELDDRRRHYRQKASQVNIPVFDEIQPMAAAFAKIAMLERRMAEKRRLNQAAACEPASDPDVT
tara:strand:+ start:18832 stop:21069 length:2238 start_codon:yes stop_codon:yes gene_type:complete